MTLNFGSGVGKREESGGSVESGMSVEHLENGADQEPQLFDLVRDVAPRLLCCLDNHERVCLPRRPAWAFASWPGI